MALLKIWGVSRAIMRLLVIQFVCWLGWFSTFALAQFEISEGVTGSVTFPALGVTCVANFAVFVTILIRGRLDLEMGARDVIDILCTPQLQNIKRIRHGYGLTTCIHVIGGGGDPQTASTEENDVQTGGGDPQTASTEENDVQTASRRGAETASTEGNVIRTASTEGGGLHTASTEENDVQTPSRRGPETASTEGNVIRTASTEGRGLHTASTAEIVVQISSTEEGQVGSEEEEEATAIAGAFTRKRGLKTAAVIMLSNGTVNWSMRQFIKSNAGVVQSIVLEFIPLKRAVNDAKVSEELTPGVTIKSCKCMHRRSTCDCIVFWTMEETTHMLASRMPGTLKPLSNSLCLLPCSTCLRKGCHDCNPENLLRAEGEASQPLRERVVSGILHDIDAGSIAAGAPVCICIPMNDARSDNWTKLLLRSLRSKEAEGRGVRNMATEALEGYLGGGRRSEKGTVEYDFSSFVVPRLTEVLINLVLTFWFRVDGFSSALVARRTVRNYLVDSKSSGFAANAFLTKAVVKSNGDNSQVCQVLTFRGRDRLCIITFMSVGCVNFICSLGWALLISFEGGPDNSHPPSLPIVVVIIAAIVTPWAVGMLVCVGMLVFGTVHYDYVKNLHFNWRPLNWRQKVFGLFGLVLMPLAIVILSVAAPGIITMNVIMNVIKHPHHSYSYGLLLYAIALIFEMACYISWSALAGTVGIKVFGRWIYGVFQILIWVKWVTGSCVLNREKSVEFFGKNPNKEMIIFFYSSSFWLNAVLAGVRSKWEAWPWRHNHLF